MDILTDLGLGPESELTRMVVNGNTEKRSILASIFDGLSSAGIVVASSCPFSQCLVSSDVTRDLGARQRQEKSVPETMRIIDAKYDKILGENDHAFKSNALI